MSAPILSASGSELRVGDEVVVESNVFNFYGPGRIAEGTDYLGRHAVVIKPNAGDGDTRVEFDNGFRDILAAESLLHIRDLPALAALRAPAPAFKVGDLVEVLRREYLVHGETRPHYGSGAPAVGTVATVRRVYGHEGAVGDGNIVLEGYYFDPAAVRPAPPAARPQVGDLVELVDPGVIRYKHPDGTELSMMARSSFRDGTERVIEGDAWHPDNVLVTASSGTYPIRVLASAVRVITPAPVEEAPMVLASDALDVSPVDGAPLADWERELYAASAADLVEAPRDHIIDGSPCWCAPTVVPVNAAESPEPAFTGFGAKDLYSDDVEVYLSNVGVRLEVFGTYAVVREGKDGSDVGSVELTPDTARDLAAALNRAAAELEKREQLNPKANLAEASRWRDG